MLYDKTLQKHIRCKVGDIAPYVLIPGDPGRAKRIAERFDEAEKIAENREYVVYTGYKDGVRLSVCSTGIGGPSAAIAVEELANLGAHTFIRVGSAGARREDIPIGSVVIVNAAVREEGTSHEYLPSIYPAIADFHVTLALKEVAEEKLKDEKFFIGVSLTRDAYYMQNNELNNILLNTDVVVSEMECATVFIVGSKRRLRVGAIVGTDSNILLKKQLTLDEKERLFYQAEKKVIDIAIDALVNLSKKENDNPAV
ncbi:MAG: uridine phosphorylase [Thermosediminibacterales bacterium]|nr:uridine phosphorylase [Thermosediminibacterales bacterium]MDK2835269.1 uridine phosphorylase [Thermosediminibacterales bacterium]